MEPFEWSSQYCIGVIEIDDDHKILISILNMAIESVNHPETCEDNVGNLLEKVVTYTQQHFRREEMVMDVCDYPHTDNHKLAHSMLIEEVADMVQKFDKDNLTAEELIEFLINWIIEHISEADYYLAGYCAGKEKLITKTLQHLPMDNILVSSI